MKNATRITVVVMGIINGLAGIEHGIGEILQGNNTPDGMMILSWPESPFFRILGGEPAMTIIPNFLITGIFAVLLSLFFMLWAARFVEKKNGALVLTLLPVAMLLVGAGFGPTVLGLILGAAACKINSPLNRWRKHLPVGFRNSMGKLWTWALGGCVAAWLALMPGASIIATFIPVNDLVLVPVLFLASMGFLLLAILTGLAHDSLRFGQAEPEVSLVAQTGRL